jgi:glycine/D-amino acid oxidase-like deaminating enzyme
MIRRIEQETDVVIIGGGISGCATAYYLAKRGVRVVLLEKDKIGAEGSGLSCGVIRKVGAVPVEIPLRMASVEIWEHVTHELKWQTGFIEGGVLYPAETEEQLKKMEEWVQIAQEAGMDCRIVSPEEFKKLVPPYEAPVVGGMYGEREGHAEPLLSTQSFAKAAEERGAHIYTNTPCWNIEVGGGRVVSVVTARGEIIKTKIVVNAAGVYAGRVANMVKFHVPCKVAALGVAETQPLPPLFRVVYRAPRACTWQSIAGTLWFVGPTAIMMDHDLGFDIFESPLIWWPRFLRFRKILSLNVNIGYLGREFRRVFGITREIRRKAEFPNVQPKPRPRRLEKYAQMQWELMPSLRGTKIARMWAGLIDVSPDMLPIVGEIDKPEGFVIATGFSGHGFTIGPIVGRLISELIIQGKPSLSLKEFSPCRFAEGKFGMPSEAV